MTFKKKDINWKKIAAYSVSAILAVGGGIYIYAYHVLSGPVYKGPKSDHYDGEEFHNLEPTDVKGFGEVIKWQLNRNQGYWPDQILKVETSVPLENIDESKARVTFINHASLLIQSGEINILTDPIWSQRASPFSFAGPERKQEPGIKFRDLPAIHVVIISHNHYDHLDISTLQQLQQAHDPLFIVPLGVDLLLKEHQVNNVLALDWFDKRVMDKAVIHALPVKHFSGRGLGDTNQTLWAGYMIEVGDFRILFGGDTGYGEFWKLIQERFEPIDLAILPIGAYKPEWFMEPIHMSPEEAVRAHIDLKASQSIGMHFGTFPMADDGIDQPVDDLHKALDQHGVAKENFKVLQQGEWMEIGTSEKNKQDSR